jgi:glycosyl transferase family 2
VQLSILMTTNRRGLLVCSRIAQACSWAGPNIEVLIRDNSGDPEKRALLPQFQRDNCNIILAEPCDALTNFNELLRLAKGDFVFLLADDDYCFDHAIAALPGVLDQIGKDPSVAGVTGLYAVETSQASAIVAYQNVESDDVTVRVANFLSYQGPNILHYAPVRREILRRVFDFMNALPFYFSFHDQITCLLYLLNGKFARLQRLLYCYDMGAWESADTAQAKDLDYYKGAGLDPAVNKLHWFLCGFEGATLIRNVDAFPDYPLEIRQRMADQWFSVNYLRFRSRPRLAYDSAFGAAAEKICAKLQSSSGQLSFQDMLVEIRNFFALFSEAHAQKYFAFWDAAINRRNAAEPRLAAAG